MPLRAVCNKCGVVLYEGAEIRAPDEIISDYDGKCPKCQRRLSFIPERAKISPSNEIDKPSRLRRKKRR